MDHTTWNWTIPVPPSGRLWRCSLRGAAEATPPDVARSRLEIAAEAVGRLSTTPPAGGDHAAAGAHLRQLPNRVLLETEAHIESAVDPLDRRPPIAAALLMAGRKHKAKQDQIRLGNAPGRAARWLTTPPHAASGAARRSCTAGSRPPGQRTSCGQRNNGREASPHRVAASRRGVMSHAPGRSACRRGKRAPNTPRSVGHRPCNAEHRIPLSIRRLLALPSGTPRGATHDDVHGVHRPCARTWTSGAGGRAAARCALTVPSRAG